MDGLGEKLLAGAAFAGYEHIAAGLGNISAELLELFHAVRIADYAVKRISERLSCGFAGRGFLFACPHEGALYPACPIVDINELKMYGVEIRHTVGIGEQYLSAEHLAPLRILEREGELGHECPYILK